MWRNQLDPETKCCEGCNIPKMYIPAVVIPHEGYNIGQVDIMFIGEQPGNEEKEQGEPFVGQSGQFLNDYIQALHEQGYNIILTNACKCWTEVKPTDSQFITCANNHLLKEIQYYNPRLIVCLGASALKALQIQGYSSVASARRKLIKLGKFTILTTYHPAMHIRYRNSNGKQGQDLTEEYINLIDMIDKFLRGEEIHGGENIQVAQTVADLDKIRVYCSGKDILSLDIETNQVGKAEDNPDICNLMKDEVKILCIGIAVDGNSAWVIPAHLLDGQFLYEITKGKTLLQSNVKFDIKGIETKLGIKLDYAGIEDTQFMNYYKDTSNKRNGLKEQCQDKLGLPDWSQDVWDQVNAYNLDIDNQNKIAKKNKTGVVLTHQGFNVVDPQTLYTYNGRDVMYAYRLMLWHREHKDIPEQYGKLHNKPGLLKRVVNPILAMEKTGLFISEKIMDSLISCYNNNVQKNFELIRKYPIVNHIEATGFPVNPRGTFPQKLLQATGMPVLATTKTGNPELSKYVKDIYKAVNPIWDLLISIDKDRTLLNNTLKNLKYHIVNGRVYTDFALAKIQIQGGEQSTEASGGTVTGRISSRNPNLQNISRDNVLRSVFQCPPGYFLLELDYPQIEVRILAWYSNCKKLFDAFMNGEDPYLPPAREAYRIPKNKPVPKELRFKAKTTVLSSGYGIGLQKLAIQVGLSQEIIDKIVVGELTLVQGLNIEMETVKRILAAYDSEYKEIREFTKDECSRVAKGELIVTPFGLQRSFNYPTGDPQRDSSLEREIGNDRTQGTAGQITLWQLCEMWDWLESNIKYQSLIFPCNIVHDAIYFYIQYTPDWKDCIKYLADIMSDRSRLPFTLDMPIDINSFKIGWNMGFMQEFKINEFDKAEEFLKENKMYVGV